MQLFPIILIAIVLVADGFTFVDGADQPPGWAATTFALGSVIAVVGLTLAGVHHCDRRLNRMPSPQAFLFAERLAVVVRTLLLVNQAVAVLVLGWLGAVRSSLRWLSSAEPPDPILIDELIVILPTLLGLMGVWWAYYPIERRVREAVLLRRLDEGQPVFALPSRWRYVLVQLRVQILLMLVPLLLILTLAETIEKVLEPWRGEAWYGAAETVTTMAAGLSVFVFAPLLVRWLLDAAPLPAGPTREALMNVCRAHRVRVRGLLLWQTGGSMINAAVMGLIGRLRYVLLTDALLELMRPSELEAVMAHEIGHVRCAHMPWMVGALLGSMMATIWLLIGLLSGITLIWPEFASEERTWLETAESVAVVAIALASFGWISRRFERQADTFAVQHLSAHQSPEADTAAADLVTERAVATMRHALGRIAVLNAVPPTRRSWRHGSIRWRQVYLETLVGKPLDGLAIDRQIRWIKRLIALVLLLSLGAIVLDAGFGTFGGALAGGSGV